LLDEDGNKVIASYPNNETVTPDNPEQNVIPGKDGITPQLKIEEDYWYVSYDDRIT
jgi:hypothetical protein